MKKKSVHSLHSKFRNLVKLSAQLEKKPRKFGTGELMKGNEIHLIELVGDNEGLSVTELAALQGVTKGAVSQALKRLEGKGFTEKQEDPENISRSLVTLTAKGKTAYWSHKHWHDTMDGGFKDYMSSLEQDKVDFLHSFLDNIEAFMVQRIKTEE
ncbi:MAG: MarR family transcriptional regulator [bacterium]|nr:MarR family transcriptional regulator [bacterium]